MNELRWPAIWRAAVSVSIFVIPIGVLQRVLVDRKTIERGSSAIYLITFVILVLGMVAGFGAAKLARTHVLPNGAAAGALTYLIAEVASLVRAAVFGGTSQPFIGVIYLALLMATCGMFGAGLERRSRALREEVPRDNAPKPD